MFLLLMIRSGLVNTQNGYSKGYKSNHDALNRYVHVERPYVQTITKLPTDSVLNPTADNNTLKRPSSTFYSEMFKKRPTDPIRQIADILVRRLTTNVPGRTLTPSVPGIQPAGGGGGPGAGGPPGGGGGGGFGAGPAQGPAPGAGPSQGPGPSPGSAGSTSAADADMGLPTPPLEEQVTNLNQHFFGPTPTFSPMLDVLMGKSDSGSDFEQLRPKDPYGSGMDLSPIKSDPVSDSNAVEVIDGVLKDFNTGISKNPQLKNDLKQLERYKNKIEQLRKQKLLGRRKKVTLEQMRNFGGSEIVDRELSKIEKELASSLAAVMGVAQSISTQARADTQAAPVRRSGGESTDPPPYTLYPSDSQINPPLGDVIDPDAPPAYEAVQGMGAIDPPVFQGKVPRSRKREGDRLVFERARNRAIQQSAEEQNWALKQKLEPPKNEPFGFSRKRKAE